MPGTGTLLFDKLEMLSVETPKGLNVVFETSNQNNTPLCGKWWSLTGQTKGPATLLADITYNQSANAAIKSASACPKNLRPYVTDVSWSVNGATAWSGGTSITLQDTLGNPFYYVPTIALAAFARGTSPEPEIPVPAVTATAASYVASTGVITFTSTPFTASAFVNTMATCVAGTGAGQSILVTANTTSTVTPATIPPIAFDSTSVFAFWYSLATAGGATSITDGKANFATMTGLGYSVIIIAGTGVGQVRSITSNTSTALTVPTWTTNPDTTSVYYITNNPTNMGVVDAGVAQNWACVAINTGISAVVNGTMTQGSPVRMSVKGFWNY